MELIPYIMRNLVVSAYNPNLAVSSFNNVPRFGHTSVITDVYDVNGGINTTALGDYIQGTLFIAGLCIAIFILWIFVLLLCKCLGRRAGISAGFPYENEANEKSDIYDAPKKKRCGSVSVMVSALTISIVGIIFLVKGARSAQSVFEDIRDGASGLQEIEGLLVNSTNDAISFGADTVPLKQNLITVLDGGICNPPDSAFQGTADQINSQAQSVVDILSVIQDFSKNELVTLQSAIDQEIDPIVNALFRVADEGEKYSLPLYIAAPIVIFGFILAFGAFLSWKGSGCSPYFCVQTWVVLPFFFLFIFLITIMAALAGTLLTVNSDVCLGGDTRSPEGTVKILVEKAGLQGTFLEAANYYVINSCEGQFTQKTEVDNLVETLTSATDNMSGLQAFLLSSDSQTFSAQCGINESRLVEIQTAVDETISAFTELESIVVQAQSIIECERINGVFVDIYHEAVCDSAPTTFLWMFSTCFIVLLLGMLIILLRGALIPAVPSDGGYEDMNKRSERHDEGQV